MIVYKDKTFCSSSGTCIKRDCARWLNMGRDYDLPISMADIKDTDSCPGYVEHPAMTALSKAVEHER